MPIISDNPTTIYVRDISSFEGEAFTKIKKKFQMTSNNEVVKTLFTRFLKLEKEYDELKEHNSQLRDRLTRSNDALYSVKETFNIIKNLQL